MTIKQATNPMNIKYDQELLSKAQKQLAAVSESLSGEFKCKIAADLNGNPFRQEQGFSVGSTDLFYGFGDTLAGAVAAFRVKLDAHIEMRRKKCLEDAKFLGLKVEATCESTKV